MQRLFSRRWIVGGVLVWLGGCRAAVSGVGPGARSDRFKGVGLVLVTDAVPGAEMLGVEFYADDSTRRFFASSVLRKGNRSIMAYPGGRVPEQVRVVWRAKNESFFEGGEIRYRGPLAGDFTIPVASRIPDEVLREIRSRGGALRLKFRLKPDGVLFGWDIERPGGGISRFEMPGGDFLDTRY